MIGTILDCTYETIQNRVIQKVRWKIWPCNFNGTPLLTNLFSCARLVFLSICPIVQYSFCPFVHLSFCSFDLTRVHSIWSGEKPIALFPHSDWDVFIIVREWRRVLMTSLNCGFFCYENDNWWRQRKFFWTPVVNFTKILQAAFAPISLSQKNTNLQCKYRKAAVKTFVKKNWS